MQVHVEVQETSGQLRGWPSEAQEAAVTTTLPRGSQISQDLGSSQKDKPEIRHTCVARVPEAPRLRFISEVSGLCYLSGKLQSFLTPPPPNHPA